MKRGWLADETLQGCRHRAQEVQRRLPRASVAALLNRIAHEEDPREDVDDAVARDSETQLP